MVLIALPPSQPLSSDGEWIWIHDIGKQDQPGTTWRLERHPLGNILINRPLAISKSHVVLSDTLIIPDAPLSGSQNVIVLTDDYSTAYLACVQTDINDFTWTPLSLLSQKKIQDGHKNDQLVGDKRKKQVQGLENELENDDREEKKKGKKK